MVNKSKENTKSKKVPQKNISELSELERKSLEKWRERDKERVGPLKFKKIKDKTVTHKDECPEKFWPKMMETVGSPDIDFFKTIMTQASNTLPIEDSEEVYNFTAALMHGLRPRNETEGILIAQMAGTHNLIMEYMRRAVMPKQFLEAGNGYTNRAYKLMDIFLRQLETLEKYRGKSSQQKVIVEHVHIHEGGQAVVGHIEAKSRGGGG
jgi:hypothetical protein